MKVVVIGAGPAGTMAAIRAAELGARTTLVTLGHFGGMAAREGPVPVRTLAQAARLIRNARELERFGMTVDVPRPDYAKLLTRVHEVIDEVSAHSSLREQIDRLGVVLHEHAGRVRFEDSHTVVSENGLRLAADRVILCTGGVSRPLDVPGGDRTATVADALALDAVPESLIVVGAGMTGLQVATIFHAFGSRVELFEAGPRILAGQDEDVAATVATALRRMGVHVHEACGTIESFASAPPGIRMRVVKDGSVSTVEAALAVRTVGWMADTTGLGLADAGIETNGRGFVHVDDHLATSAPHVFAAGDVTGRFMLVPPSLRDGWVAATNAVSGPTVRCDAGFHPIGSFTDPEYAHVGLGEAEALRSHDAVVVRVQFDETPRTIIDGRTVGFCKLIADRSTHGMLGCHVVGERAVDIVQVAAVAMAAGMRVDDLARVPLSYPTYAAVLARAAFRAEREI